MARRHFQELRKRPAHSKDRSPKGEPASMSGPHSKSHMSPADAAQVAGVSRWAIMRAIKSHKLQARRDNRNHWQIAKDDLAQWCAHSVRHQQTAHPDETAELRTTLAGETARADAAERAREQAEADRDRWQAMAEKLTERRSFKWPWQN